MPRVLGRRNQIKEACQSFTRSAELSYGAPTDDLTNNESIASHKSRHDEEQRIYLTSIGIRNSGTGDIFHLAKGSQLAEPALSPGNTNDEVSERWRRSSPKIVVIDDFLTNEALDGVRRFCWGGLEVIRDDPEKDFGVLDLPKWYFPSSFYMLQQACHSRPIAQGDTSRDVVVSLRDRLRPEISRHSSASWRQPRSNTSSSIATTWDCFSPGIIPGTVGGPVPFDLPDRLRRPRPDGSKGLLTALLGKLH